MRQLLRKAFLLLLVLATAAAPLSLVAAPHMQVGPPGAAQAQGTDAAMAASADDCQQQGCCTGNGCEHSDCGACAVGPISLCLSLAPGPVAPPFVHLSLSFGPATPHPLLRPPRA